MGINEYSITSDSYTKMSKKILCANKLKFADLSNIYYALVAISLHIISILNIYRQIKVLMFTLMVDLSTQITERLEQNNHPNDLQNLDQLHQNLLSSKFFITNQFATSITFLVLSIVSMFWFGFFSLFKTGNLSNDNVQLGNHMITIDNFKKYRVQIITNNEYSLKNESTPLNFSLSSLSSPQSDTSGSSSFTSSSTSFMSSGSTDSSMLKPKFFTLIRIFYLPPLNCCFHLLMCYFLVLVKLDLAKFQQAYDVSEKLSNESLFINSTNCISEYEIDLNHINYIIALIVLNFKLTRVYCKMNHLYSLIVFIQLTLFGVIDLGTYSAFETLFKTQNTRDNLSARIEQSDLKSILFNDKNVSLSSKSDSLFLENEILLILAYSSSWLLNIIYLSSFNIFGFSFFRQAHLKIRYKYDQYILRYSTKNIDTDKKSTTKNSSLNLNHNLRVENSSIFSKIGVKNQYKAILVGILFLLVLEAFRVPLIYSFYIKYFQTNSRDVYLIALILHLIYLVSNALFWILMSFKTDWTVKFTSDFRVLFWNRLFTEYFYARNPKKNVSTDTQNHKNPFSHICSKNFDGNFVSRVHLLPKPLKNASKIFIKKRRNNFEHVRNTNAIDGYFLTEVSRLPSYQTKPQHTLFGYDRKFVDYSIESLLKSHSQCQLKKLYFNEPKSFSSSGVYIPQVQEKQIHNNLNFSDNNLSDNNSDLNVEIDELEIKVKMDKAPKQQASCVMSSFNKLGSMDSNSISEMTENTTDTGCWEPLPIHRNEQIFERKKLFNIMLNENNKKLKDKIHYL